MKVIKKINNNVAVCIDSNNFELIAYGKGIGFHTMPYELDDLSLIDKTFYELDYYSVNVLKDIPEELLAVTILVVDKAKNYLNTNFSDSFVMTLADHLHFSIQRANENIAIQNPLAYDIQHLYSKEFEMAKWTRRLVVQRLKINLPIEEESNIAMHFVNAQLAFNLNEEQTNDIRIIDDITFIIEQQLDLVIDRDEFNYARFTSHLLYLLKRKTNDSLVNSKNINLFKQLRKDFPEIYYCTIKIGEYFLENLDWKLNDDELMYLMLHINRLHNRNRL